MGLPETYRKEDGIPLFQKKGIFEEIEDLEPIIIQGVHRTATAIKTGVAKSFFVLSSQPHLDYLLKIAQDKVPEPDGWNYSTETLRILPTNYRTIESIPFKNALESMEKEYQHHLEGWTMDDFFNELEDRFPNL